MKPERKCKIEKCVREKRSAGLCDAHWRQVFRNREPGPIAGPHGAKGERIPVLCRVTPATARKLKKRAKKDGMDRPSVYSMINRVLEEWATKQP
jgi:hypothetical protein